MGSKRQVPVAHPNSFGLYLEVDGKGAKAFFRSALEAIIDSGSDSSHPSKQSPRMNSLGQLWPLPGELQTIASSILPLLPPQCYAMSLAILSF